MKGPWLTPMPSRNRLSYASATVFWAAAVVMGWRAWTCTMPVAIFSVLVAPSMTDADTNGSRPTASGIHTVGQPISSSSATTSRTRFEGCWSKTPCHNPMLPMSILNSASLSVTQVSWVGW